MAAAPPPVVLVVVVLLREEEGCTMLVVLGRVVNVTRVLVGVEVSKLLLTGK